MRIFINDILVPCGNDELNITMKSSLFNEQDGSTIYNFTLPASDELLKACGFVNRLNAGRPHEVNFKLQQDSFILIGIGLIIKFGKDVYELQVGFNKGDFNYLIKDKKLNDDIFDYGEINVLYTAKAKNTIPLQFNMIYDPGSPAQSEEIPFNTIEIDNNSSFSYLAKSYTCNHSGKFILLFDFPAKANNNNAFLSLYINNVYLKSYNFINNEISYTIMEELNLQLNDTIKFLLRHSGQIDTLVSVVKESKFTVIESVNDLFFNSNMGYYPTYKHVLSPIYNDKYFESIDNNLIKDKYSLLTVQNYFNNGEFPLFVDVKDLNNNILRLSNIFIPGIYVAHILNSIASSIGYTIENNIFNDSEFSKLYLIINKCINDYSQTQDTTALIPYDSIKFRDYIPDILISDFMNSLSFIAGIVFFTNSINRTISIVKLSDICISGDITSMNNCNVLNSFNKDLFDCFSLKYNIANDYFISNNFKEISGFNFKGDFLDIQSIDFNPKLNDYIYSASQKAYYAYIYDENILSLAWVSICKNFIFEKNITGNAIYEKSSNLIPMMRKEPLFRDDISFNTLRMWMIPTNQQSGYFKFGYESWNSQYTPYLLMYRGMFPDGLGNLFPYSDNHVTDMYDTKISEANISLRIISRNSNLYSVYSRWESFLNFLINCKEFNIYKSLTALDIKNIDFSKRVRIQSKNMFLKEVKFKISNKGIETTEITGIG